jgi:protein TonB
MWKTKKNNSKISLSFAISISLHLVLSFYFVNRNMMSDKINDSLNLTKINNKNSKAIKLSEIKFITKKQVQELKKQLVRTAQNNKTDKEVKSRFSGESNQEFDRQTIAAKIDTYHDAGLGQKNAKNQVQIENQPTVAEVKKVSKKSMEKNPKLSLSDFGTFKINTNDHEEAEEMIKQIEKAQKNKTIEGIENGAKGVVGLAANNDFVEDVPLGDVTNLNTTENKYYGFYLRIRQKLEQHWGSTIQSRAKSLYKSGRRVPASENLITAVIVVLNEKGNIVDIKIEGTSGIRELDQAAVESFNKAGPFPNPPKGLLVDGRAVIQWGFVVKS